MKIKLFIFSSIILLFACNKEQKFKKTDGGLEYCFIETNDSAKTPNYDDALIIDMKFYWNDSLMFNTRDISLDYKLRLEKPQVPGSLNEGLELMHIGDSAIFKVDAYKFYTITADISTPRCIKKGDKLVFYVKLLNIMAPEEVQKEFERYKTRQVLNEKNLLVEYLKNNNIDVEPTNSGLYFISQNNISGKKPQNGDSVYVHYSGKLINNQPFESTYRNNKPFGFIYGDENFIDGWTEGIGLMHQNEKALLIIPSKIAYGEKGVTDIIPPFSTIIFDVHLLKIKKNK